MSEADVIRIDSRVDPSIPDPLKVLRKLYVELVARRRPIDRAANYYDGAHNLAFSGEKFLEAFGGLFGAFADNWCGVVINAVAERIEVQGFRVNDEPEADDDAHRIWQANEMDAQSQMGHIEGLIGGAHYVTVWPGEVEGIPEVTVESAATTIVQCHPKIRRRRTAALRTWMDDDGYEHAELFLPDYVWCFKSKTKRTSGLVDPARGQWVRDDHPTLRDRLDESGRMENPWGIIPVVEFMNIPRLRPSRRVGWIAHSEIASVIPLQDAVNKLLADMLVASEFAAYPQRHLVGYEPDVDEKTGEVIPPKFRSSPGDVWWLEDTDARFGTFDAANLETSVKAVEMVVGHIGKISSTPPHYLDVSADRLSGESLKSSETGLVSKAKSKHRHLGAGWEEVQRIIGTIAGIPTLANAESMETIWRDPETRSESEHVDAVLKKQAANVPDPQLWEEMGYTPEQIKRFPALRAQSQLEGMAAVAARRADEAAQLSTAET